MARVHTQLYLSIESNRKICRLQLGRLSIRKKNNRNHKTKKLPVPPSGPGSGLGKSMPEQSGRHVRFWDVTRTRHHVSVHSGVNNSGVGVNPFTIAPLPWSCHSNKLWDFNTPVMTTLSSSGPITDVLKSNKDGSIQTETDKEKR